MKWTTHSLIIVLLTDDNELANVYLKHHLIKKIACMIL